MIRVMSILWHNLCDFFIFPTDTTQHFVKPTQKYVRLTKAFRYQSQLSYNALLVAPYNHGDLPHQSHITRKKGASQSLPTLFEEKHEYTTQTRQKLSNIKHYSLIPITGRNLP